MIHITIVEGCSLKYLYIPLHIQNIFFIFIISGHFKLIAVTFYCSFLKYFYCFNQKYKSIQVIWFKAVQNAAYYH